MSMTILSARLRTAVGRKTNVLRAEGLVPAVAYGPALATPKTLSIDRAAFVRAYKDAGESSIVELQVEGEKALHVLIQDLQVDPLRGEVTHVDFRAVDMSKPVDAKVKLVFKGDSTAMKAGGTLIHALDALEIRALPANLPHELVVDISKLVGFEDTIKVKDIALPTGVQVLNHADATVAIVEAPRSEEEMAALNQAVDIDVSKVEVVEKKKVEGEEAEGAEGAAAPDAKKADAAKKPEAKK